MSKKLKLITEHNLENFQVITESGDATKPQTIMMKGMYLASDVKNGNNRIYPYEDLKPTVEKFIKEKIDTKTALEELEHSECQLTPDFEILTENGFEWFQNLKVGDLVWTRNPATKKAELKPIKRIISDNYAGNGYIVHGKNIFGEFTADHRVVMEDRYGKTVVKTIEEIYNDRSAFHNSKIPKTLDADDVCGESETFTLPAVKSFAPENIYRARNHQRFEHDLVIDKMVFSKLFGFWLAEGGSILRKDGNGMPTGGEISLSQSLKANRTVCDMIDDLFSQLPDELKEHSKTNIYKDGRVKIWRITDIRIAKYFNDCGNMYTKRIPKEVLQFGKPYLENLVYYFGLGDGRKTVMHLRKYNNTLLDNLHDVFSTSQGLIDDLSYCILKCGISTAKRAVSVKKDVICSDGRIIKAENCRTLYVASLLTSPYVCMDKRSLKIEKIHVSEDDAYGAYCI